MENKKRNNNIFTSQGDKASDEYGLQYALYIDKEWNLNSENGKFSIQKQEIKELQDHMIGNINIQKYSDIIGVDIDKSSIALNWEALSVIPKYINVVADGFPEDLYQVTANGIDAKSVSDKNNYKKSLHKEIINKDWKDKMLKAINQPPQDVDEKQPETEEELDLHMQYEYKPSKEMAIEIATKKIFEYNNYTEINSQKNEDLTLTGLAGIRHFYDNEIGIKFRRVNPKNLIYSFDINDTRNKTGSFYAGEVLPKTIDQISKETNKFTEDELKEMARGVTSRFGNDREVTSDNYRDFIIEVLDFTFESVEEDVYKKTKRELIKKKSNWNPKSSANERITNRYKVWYEGFYIIGTNKIYNYHKLKNMLRPKSNIKSVLSPFIIYKTSSQSIGSRLKPLAENIFIIYMKLQQVIAKMKPKGIAIDIDALQDLDLGGGQTLQAIEQIKIYRESGDLLYSGTALDGSLQKVPIHDIHQSGDNNIIQLINAYNHYRTLIEEVTGINKFKDGSTPSGEALVGVQKLAIDMSNNAVKHIFRGSLDMTKRLAEATFTRLQDMSFDKNISEGIINAIGSETMDVINDSKKLHLYAFGVVIKMKPTEQEKAQFHQDLQLALQTKSIDITDKIDLQSIENIKYANKMLKIIKKKNKKEQQKMFQQQRQAEAQAKIQENNAAAQQKKQEMEIEYMFSSKKANEEFKRKLAIMQREFIYDMKLKELDVTQKINKEDKAFEQRKEIEENKETAKDKRLDKQNTQKSEMITQRQENLPSKKFGEEKGEGEGEDDNDMNLNLF